MLTPPSFVVFSDDWGGHPSSAQHLFRHISRTHRVLWVNTIGMRRPTFSLTDLRKVGQKAGRMLRGSSKAAATPAAPDNPRVCQPMMLPYSHIRAVRAFNARSVATTVAREIDSAGLVDPIIVTTVPNACDYADSATGSRVVYYCVDDFTQWPGLDSGLVRGMEDQLLRRADLVIASSETLRARIAATGKDTRLLTHGVDADHFRQANVAEHPLLSSIRRPRAGYFGLIDDRMDRELLAAVARAMPEVSFVLVGPVEADVSLLKALPNVVFTGRVPYQELPAIIAGLDVLLLPYKADEFGDTLAPLKMKEYLISGKPVIAAPIAEARRMAEHLCLAASRQEWVAALRGFLDRSPGHEVRDMTAALASETWQFKAEQFVQMCGTPGQRPHA